MTGNQNDSDLSSLTHILNALHKCASNHDTYQKSLEQVVSNFDQNLHEEILIAPPAHHMNFGDFKGALHVLSPLKEQSAIVDQIKSVADLTDRQIRLVIRAGILKIDQNGRPTLKDRHAKLISKNKGIAYLFMLGLLSGVVISQIIYQPTNSLAYPLYGLGFGLAIGSVAGLILDRSFRAYPIVKELENLAPWMAIT